jgi:small glutamine-rich tetratricopeptide repeat-containing protein alpha
LLIFDYSKTAIEVNPEYVKAYYRLGQVYHDLGNDEQALFTFEKGLEVAKKNGDSTMISSIQDEISRINELSNTQDSGAPNFDLGSIMSNPMFANLASQMMSNPGMMESMLGGMGGGAPAGPTDPKFKDTLDKMKDKPEFSVCGYAF